MADGKNKFFLVTMGPDSSKLLRVGVTPCAFVLSFYLHVIPNGKYVPYFTSFLSFKSGGGGDW